MASSRVAPTSTLPARWPGGVGSRRGGTCDLNSTVPPQRTLCPEGSRELECRLPGLARRSLVALGPRSRRPTHSRNTTVEHEARNLNVSNTPVQCSSVGVRGTEVPRTFMYRTTSSTYPVRALNGYWNQKAKVAAYLAAERAYSPNVTTPWETGGTCTSAEPEVQYEQRAVLYDWHGWRGGRATSTGSSAPRRFLAA